MSLPEWWTPVERTEIKVVGPDDAEPALLRIRFSLGPRLTSEKWVDYFLHPQLDHWQSFRRPARESIAMGTVGFITKVEDGRLEDFVATIDRCISEANAKFELEDIPVLVAEEARSEETVTAKRARIDEAQRKLDSL